VEIVNMLYCVAIENTEASITNLKSGDRFARSASVTKAQTAVDELILALDHSVGAPFTRTMAELYQYILQQLIIGHVRQSETAFREALSILKTLSNTWVEVKARVLAPETPSVEEQEAEEHQPRLEPSSPYSAYETSAGAAGSSRDWSC
jgi:flagellin-specific chaperone FliS